MGIWLARHGATEWSENGRHTGRMDISLIPKGERQAEALGLLIGAHPFERVLVSPLSRARETARLAGFGDRAEVNDLLAEWDYGDYEGRTTEDVQRERPGWELYRDGCPGGEQPEGVSRRMDRLLLEIGTPHGDVLLFGHGHALRSFSARYLGQPVLLGALLRLEAGSLSILGSEHGHPAIQLWNELP